MAVAFNVLGAVGARASEVEETETAFQAGGLPGSAVRGVAGVVVVEKVVELSLRPFGSITWTRGIQDEQGIHQRK